MPLRTSISENHHTICPKAIIYNCKSDAKHLHLQDTKQCLDRPLRFGNTSAQWRERLEIKL
jgi:hypothetical protein